MVGTWKPRQCTLELCQRAAQMLRDAGFEHAYTSMKTEAVYYRLPGYYGLLRVAAHSKDKTNQIHGFEPIAARVTFNGGGTQPPGTLLISDEKVETVVAQAIGFYMMRARPPRESDTAAP